MTEKPGRLAQAVPAIVALFALFVAVPVALLRVTTYRYGSRNPLTEISPPWRWDLDQITEAARQPLDDDTAANLLIRTSLTVLWLVLLVIAVTIVVEVVHMIRHRGMPSPRVRGLGWAQTIARWIAVGLIALLPINSVASAGSALDLPSPATSLRSAPADAAPFGPLGHDAGRTVENHLTSLTEQSPPIADRGGDQSVATLARPDRNAVHVVGRGESVYGIAADLAQGDRARTNEIANGILDLNLGRVMDDGQPFSNPALINPGWTLTLPVGVEDRPAAELVAGSSGRNVVSATDIGGVSDQTSDDRDDHDDHVVHMVIEGDTLHDIAGEEMGDEAAWPAIWEANRGDDMGGGRTFDDPDLILPGWALDMPIESTPPPVVDDSSTPPAPQPSSTPDNDSAAPTDADSAPTDADSVAVTDPGTTESVTDSEQTNEAIDADAGRADADAAEPDATGATDVDATDAELLPTETDAVPVFAESDAVAERVQPDSTPETSTPATTPTTQPAVAGSGDAGGSTRSAQPAPEAPSPVRLEHAALLAAGILTLVAVRRRRSLRSALPHARVPAPPADVAATERRLRSIDPGERALRVDVAVRAASYRIAETGVGIGSVRIAPDGSLLIRLTDSARLSAPWVGEGASWSLPASVPVEMLTDDARRVGQPCLALVTIGIDDEDRDVLIDLEAAGTTVVEAQSHQADEVVRAMASGLATSLSSEVVHLVVAGLGVECLFDHPNGHQAASTRSAVDTAIELVGSTQGNERSSFDLRVLRTGGEMWEPAVVLLTTGDEAGAGPALSALPGPSHGVAAVTTGSAADLAASGVHVGARVTAHSDRWVLDAFGEQVDMTPIGVSESDVAELGEVLADAELPIEPAPIVRVDAEDEESADPLTPVPHEIVVSLMGAVEVSDRNGQAGTFERSKTIELIAWLATHRERATRSSARTALWEMNVRDATFANVVSEARRGLGRLVTPPDGGEWLARTLNESLPLHPSVVTDADLIRERVDHAQMAPPGHAMEVLRPAVEMIRDMPFAGTSYLWPDADGITSNLVLLATTAAAELAGHALSVGDTDLVFWSTGQGLKVLPGHEELIGLRMRAHARAGDLAGVRQEWESYERTIMADSWSDGEPAPKLLDLRRQLLSPNG